MVKIAVGAGHGINTAGKRTPDDEREWTFNNKVVTALIEKLKEYQDVEVIRLDDPTGKRDVPLKERTDKANKFKVDVLISCHHNANTGKWGNWTGTETYHYPNSTNGKKLAQAIHPNVVKAYGLRDRGIKSDNFHMLRESKMPAILIEGGFMDSTIDIKKLRDDKVLENAGIAIAEGIAKYSKLKKKPTPKPKPVAKPTPQKKADSDKLYRVQSGAFKVRGNADSLEKQLKAKGYDSYLIQAGGLYKVQVGAFADKKNAENLSAKLKKDGFDAYITNESGSPAKAVAPKKKANTKKGRATGDVWLHSKPDFTKKTRTTVLKSGNTVTILGNANANMYRTDRGYVSKHYIRVI